MKSAELREVVEAIECRCGGEFSRVHNRTRGCPIHGSLMTPAVETVANHAAALVELLAAYEARQGAVCRPHTTIHAGCWQGYHVAGCPVARADEVVARALAAVHLELGVALAADPVDHNAAPLALVRRRDQPEVHACSMTLHQRSSTDAAHLGVLRI